MNTTYSKQQIQQAIAYWSKKLDLMQEAEKKYNDLIDDLVGEFGHDLVFGTKYTYVLNDADAKKIFNILNKHLFNNELKNIPILYRPDNYVKDVINDYAIQSGVPNKQIPANAKIVAAYTAIAKDVLDDNNEIKDVDITNDIILINNSLFLKCVFIYAVATICHEMIHYYDRFTEEHQQKVILASKTQEDFNSHKDIAFQKKMQEANKLGINVVENVSDSHINNNYQARWKLYDILGENDNETFVNLSKDTLITRGNGSSTFMFCHFD